MPSKDDIAAAGFIGLLGGMALAGNSQQDQQLLAEAKQLKAQLDYRRNRFGALPPMQLINDPVVQREFTEAYRLYVYGFYRASAITSAAVIEYLLQKKYGSDSLATLIEKAKKDSILGEGDTLRLHSVRIDRNDFVHRITQAVSEDDALIILQITKRVLENGI